MSKLNQINLLKKFEIYIFKFSVVFILYYLMFKQIILNYSIINIYIFFLIKKYNNILNEIIKKHI